MNGTAWRRAALAIPALAGLAGCAPAVILAGAGAVTGASVAQERSTADQVEDLEAEIAVRNRLAGESAALGLGVGVEVVEGRALLTGAVATPAEAETAEALARGAPGVSEVINEIAVGGGAGVGGYAEDAWISTQLRSRLVTDGRVAALNYDVETHDGVVHLLGLARSQAELERVTDIAASTPGVRQVVSHVLLIDDPRRKAP
jgi:osmotically-inducible protein OsmY